MNHGFRRPDQERNAHAIIDIESHQSCTWEESGAQKEFISQDLAADKSYEDLTF